MKSLFPIIFIAMLSLPAIALAQADDAIDEDSAPIPDYSNWYQVEIIVFAPHDPPPGDEIWPAEHLSYPAQMLSIDPASDDDLRPLNLYQLHELLYGSLEDQGESAVMELPFPQEALPGEDRGLPTAAPESTPLPAVPANEENTGEDEATRQMEMEELLHSDLPRAFRALGDDAKRLQPLARSLTRSSRYRLLLHTGWLQPVDAGAESIPVLIQTGDRYADFFEIEGTIAVSRSRFLHVETDLWFTQFVEKNEQELPLPDIVNDFDIETRLKYGDLVEAERQRDNFIRIQSHSMKLSRRMRSATLHYLDNPYFGVLIQIDEFKYEPPEPVPEEQPPEE